MRFPDVGERKILSYIETATDDFLEIGLFKSLSGFDASMGLGDLVECNFSGYARAPLLNSAIAGSPDGNGRAVMTWSDVYYDHNGGATSNQVYGFFFVDTRAPTVLIGVDWFPNGPLDISQLEDSIVISPRLACSSEV